jgi:hypothetical protein
MDKIYIASEMEPMPDMACLQLPEFLKAAGLTLIVLDNWNPHCPSTDATGLLYWLFHYPDLCIDDDAAGTLLIDYQRIDIDIDDFRMLDEQVGEAHQESDERLFVSTHFTPVPA